MNCHIGDMKGFPAPQNFAFVYHKQVDYRGEYHYENYGANGFQNGHHREFRKQYYRKQEHRRKHKSEIGVDEEYRNHEQNREKQFHSRVHSVNDGVDWIVLSERYVLKHRFPPPSRFPQPSAVLCRCRRTRLPNRARPRFCRVPRQAVRA